MHPDTDIYLQVRRKEGRIFSDDIVRQLPDLPADHVFCHEWKVRAASAGRMLGYLEGLNRPLTILDLGCGNGWLTHRVAQTGESRVIGLDRNRLELEQAARVFGSGSRLLWAESNILSAPFAQASFDIILVAAAIQYFPDLRRLILALRALLAPGGEIHLLDSPLYAPEALAAARERSRQYYENLGIPRMAEFYHHHPVTDLDAFNPVFLYRPARDDSPFPWIRLQP
jgi:SAM-dependent methyltransferase